MPSLAVSVILPVFNGAHTIHRAIDSILNQSLYDLELIIVDDGSTDQTPSVLSGIDDKRIHIVRTDHSGVASASNLGLTYANGKYIARMDADDWAHPHKLEKQLHWLKLHQLDVVGSFVRIVDQVGNPVTSLQRYERWLNEETTNHDEITSLRFVEFPLANPTILAVRGYFELNFKENDLPEDYDLMLNAARLGMKFGKVPERLLDWTDHSHRVTRNDSRYSTDAFDRCRRKHLMLGPLKTASHVDLWGVGKTGRPWLKWLLSEGISVRKALDIDRRKINSRIHNVPVHHPDVLSEPDGTPIVIAVGADGARSLIKNQLLKRGYRPGIDAWFVA